MKKLVVFLVLLSFLLVLAGYFYVYSGNRNALEEIVARDCRVAAPMPRPSPPCEYVDPSKRYVLLRDRKGSVHYLLLPTIAVAGIESPALIGVGLPDYFSLAWAERGILSRHREASFSDREIMLAINSTGGRSQDLLHIHIACMRPEVRRALDDREPDLGTTSWEPLHTELQDKLYLVRHVETARVNEMTPFERLAKELAVGTDKMGDFALAMVAVEDGFLLLATERDLLDLNFGSAGELQDYDCRG
jgi:CDP-diacylglycerol pyrophosphatase